MFEIKKKLEKNVSGKSSGHDGLNSYFLKKCCLLLHLIFVKSITHGKLPNIWKKANVSPTFKSGSKLEKQNYRQVSLTCILGKVLEKVIGLEITEFLINDLLLNANQHGFMPRKSCATNLIESIDILTDALNNGKMVHVVYTDFSKAFDKVDHDLLLLKTEAYGFSGYILEWIKDFLNERESNSRKQLLGMDKSQKWGSSRLSPVSFALPYLT